VALGLVGYKALSRGSTTSAAAAQPAPRVFLFADLREADRSCGCGEVIRAVRAAAARGVPVRENDDAPAREHHVTVQPSVIIVDTAGRETARHEGESEMTIQALKKDLDAIRSDPR
jgi:hypothetical protein